MSTQTTPAGSCSGKGLVNGFLGGGGSHTVPSRAQSSTSSAIGLPSEASAITTDHCERSLVVVTWEEPFDDDEHRVAEELRRAALAAHQLVTGTGQPAEGDRYVHIRC